MLESLENKIFSHLKKLKFLNLSRNKITFLNEETFIGASENLYELDLSYNKITRLNFNVFKPIAPFKRYPLELKLDSNQIKEISEKSEPNSIHFYLLSLNKNHISYFSCIGVNITEIYLNENNLQTFDCNAQYISITKNNVKYLKLQNDVKGFAANGNNIKEFNVDEKSEMMYLDVSNNGDISQELETIKTMADMKRLNISYSFIGTVNDDLFAKMENLTNLYMSACGLKVISSRLFSNNGQLVNLDISNNKLNAIDLNVFNRLKKLTFLDISDNKLSRIGNLENIKMILPELKHIVISGNPWKCIELSTIVRTLKQFNIKIADNNKINKNYNVQNILGIPCY